MMEILSIKVLILISVFKLKAVTVSANQNLIFPLEKSLGKHGNQTYISSNLQNRSRLTDVENQLNGYRGGKGQLGSSGWTYTPLYLKWIPNKVLVYGTWNAAQCHVPNWTGG